jgi:BlaI family penicillinase repressor
MAKVPQISEAEWDVMKVLWDRQAAGPAQPLTAGEIVDALAANNRWHPRTIKTLLSRLVKKGAVEFTAEGRRYLYRAKVDRQACVRRESRSFLSRVFDGAAAPAVVYFLEQTNLPPREIERLRRVLEREESQAPRHDG